jgi:hypothetical protein
MEYKYGELENWDDVDVKTGSSYMKLELGNNVVRVITQPYQFTVCWIKDPTGVPRKVRSALVPACPLVKRGEKLQKRWYVGVINRRTGKPEILEISSQIISALKDLASDPDWGNPKGYDVDVKRGTPGSQPLYRVIAKPQKPLSEDDKTMAAQFIKDTDFIKMTKPPTPEEVAERLVAIDGGHAGGSGGNSGGGNSGGGKQNIDPKLFSFDEEQL